MTTNDLELLSRGDVSANGFTQTELDGMLFGIVCRLESNASFQDDLMQEARVHICLGPPGSLTFQETLEFILNQQTDVGAFGDESTSEIGLRAQKVRETTRSFAESLFRVLEMFCKK